MSEAKTLAERALRCLSVLRDLPIVEKAAVLGLMNVLITVEAKMAETAKLPPGDEHYTS